MRVLIGRVEPFSQEEVNWAANLMISSKLMNDTEPSSQIEARVKQYYRRLKSSRLHLVSQFCETPNQKTRYGLGNNPTPIEPVIRLVMINLNV